MKLIICPCCNIEKKHHAKGMCKPCYCKSDIYKILRSKMDKEYQLKNKSKVYQTRNLRRKSDKYKESDEYVKHLIYNTYRIPRDSAIKYPYFIESKKAELKLVRAIKKIKQNGE
jgi:hypothetical protein